MQQLDKALQHTPGNLYGQLPPPHMGDYSLTLIDSAIAGSLLGRALSATRMEPPRLLNRIAKLCKLLVEADGYPEASSKAAEHAVMLFGCGLTYCGETTGLPTLDMARKLHQEREERWDGMGYKHGLAGTEISLVTRAWQICDAYIKLISRKQSSQLSKSENYSTAFDILYDEAGKRYDPRLVRLLYADVVGELIVDNSAQATNKLSSEGLQRKTRRGFTQTIGKVELWR